LLLGDGFAIASRVESSGLTDTLSWTLASLEDAPYLAFVPTVSLICSVITFNDTTITLLVPLRYHMAKTMDVHLLLLVVTRRIVTEFAF